MGFDARISQDIMSRLERSKYPLAVCITYADQAPEWGREISNWFKRNIGRTAERLLALEYPLDRATGYAGGQTCGAYSVQKSCAQAAVKRPRRRL